MPKCQIIKYLAFLLVIFISFQAKGQTDSTVVSDSMQYQDTLNILPEPDPVAVLDTSIIFLDTAVPPLIMPEFQPGVGLEPYGNSLDWLSLRLITGQTSKLLNKKVLEFCVQHRFGYFSGGKEQFYGFDQSDVRLGFDYGLTRKITLGVGRSSLGKTFNGYAKLGLSKQSKEMPLTATWLTDMYISSLKNTDPDLDPFYPSHRYKFVNQLIVSRSFGQRAVLMIAPTLIHRNLVDSVKYPNDLSLLVMSARVKLTRSINLTGEYAYMFNHDMRTLYPPCLGMGFEINTSGHIFQIVFTNTNSMNEADAFAMKNGKINQGDWRMGFNIVRQF